MSKREEIVARVTEVLKAQRNVKLGQVSRDPIVLEELARTSFPAVVIESTNEERVRAAFSGLRECAMEVSVLMYVNGKERDRQRNTVAEAVEQTIESDEQLNTLTRDIFLQRIEAVELGEASPYGSMRLVFQVDYCY
jgi:hypothetical protein